MTPRLAWPSRLLCLWLATLLLAPLPAEEAALTWGKRDQKRLATLERGAVHDELYGMWMVAGTDWQVEAGASARYAAEAALFMEKVQTAFDELVSDDRRVRGFQPTVVIFASETTFRDLHGDKDRHRFEYRWNENDAWTEFHYYSYMGEDEQVFADCRLDKLAAETARACLQQALGRRSAPPWLKYGIRAYFRSWHIQDSIADNLKQRAARSRYLPALREVAARGLPSLRLVLSRESDDFRRSAEDQEENYALVEALVDLLLGSKAGRKIMAEVIDNLTSKSEDTPPLSDERIQQLEPLWHAHIRRLTKEQ